MNAPRALSLNPGKKRMFRILAHQEQAKPNPVKARKGKTQLRAQTKFGAPLQLSALKEIPYTTEQEIRRRVGKIDDHLLAQYPQIIDDLVPWLSRQSEGGNDLSSDDLEDFLRDALRVKPGEYDPSSDIIKALVEEKILFEDKSSLVLAGPGVGKPPPFTNAKAGVRWALINVGADPDRDEPLIQHLDEMPLDEDGEIDASDLSEFLTDNKDGLFHEEGEFVPEDIGELLDNLVKANVLIDGVSRETYYYDASVAGRSDPYVVAHLKKRVVSAKQKGADKSVLTSLQEEIRSRDKSIGRAGHFDEPPAGRPKSKLYKRVPKLPGYSTAARPVQDILPGDQVYEMGPVAHFATKVVSVEKSNGDWYTLTVQDGAGKQFTKRKKKDALVAIKTEVAEKVVEPRYHPAERLGIADPQLLHVLSYFEGAEWVHKQSRFPKCQKCYYANKQAWDVLKSMGSKAKGLTVGMLLEGGGRLQGAEHTGHWYQIDADGFVNIEGDTATDSTRKAMQEVGIDAV